MRQVSKIAELGSREWHGGFWSETQVPIAGGAAFLKRWTYTPNSREEYSNAIAVLEHLLLPHLDEEAGKEVGEIKAGMKAALSKTSAGESTWVTRSKVKLRYRQKLLRCLSKFLKRVDYFSEMGGET